MGTERLFLDERNLKQLGFTEPNIRTMRELTKFLNVQNTVTNVVGPIEAITTTGLLARIGLNQWATRQIVVPSSGISITFPDGVADNPTLALANDLAALEALAGTGFSVRTAVDTWTNRSIAVTSGHLTVSNADGVAGNPTLGLPNSGVTAASYTLASITVDAQGRVTAASSGTAGASAGAIGSSGLTMSTGKLLGRTTASSGAVEEISVGSGLSLSAGSLSATGSGGGSSWALAGTGTGHAATGKYDNATDGNQATIEFTGLAGKADIMIMCVGTTRSASAVDIVQVSVDNGTSYFTTSGDYVIVPSSGSVSNSTAATVFSTASTAARSGIVIIKGANLAAPRLMQTAQTDATRFFVADTTNDIDAVKVSVNGGGNFTGGKIYCLAR